MAYPSEWEATRIPSGPKESSASSLSDVGDDGTVKPTTLLAPGRDDWLVVLLLAAVIAVPVYATERAGWVGDSEVLWPIALAALAVGWMVARLPALVGLPLGVLAGLAYVYVEVGKVMPYPRPLHYATTAMDLAWQLAGGPVLRVLPPKALAIPDYFQHSGQNALEFAYRLGAWGENATTGRTSTDNLVFLAFLGIGAWLITLWASWCVYRLQHAALGVVPAGVAMVAVTINSRADHTEIILFSCAALLLALRVNLRRMMSGWDRRGVDYADEIELDAGFAAFLAIAAVTLLASLVPAATTNPASETFWTAFRRPWSQVEATVNRVFAGVQRTNVGGVDSSEQVVLGGSIQSAGQDILFLLRTDEPPPIPRQMMGHLPASDMPPPSKHYVRSLTFDTYRGLQWGRHEEARSRRQANEQVTLGADRLSGQRVEQSYEILSPRSQTALVMNQPISADVAYEVVGSEEDIQSLTLDRVRSRYRVVSVVPQPTQRQLRQAGERYPSWVQRYLELPSVPQRVIDLANEVTAKSATPFDKAQAIETYLRRLEYSAQVVPPPQGKDAVEHFLFEGRKGYCDYFASAMVVMLRAEGIPARLATGYATDEYNYDEKAYVARQRDAHSWPEVYFPGVGWVEFEPTPANPVINRPADAEDILKALPQVEAQPSESESATGSLRLPVSPWWLSPLGVLALAYGFLRLSVWWTGRLSAAEYGRLVYSRLCLYAGWLGAVRRPSQTPYEYGQDLQSRLRGDFGAAAARVCDLYVRSAYSHQGLSQRQRRELGKVWSRLRWKLWRLRWPEKEPGSASVGK